MLDRATRALQAAEAKFLLSLEVGKTEVAAVWEVVVTVMVRVVLVRWEAAALQACARAMGWAVVLVLAGQAVWALV